MASLLEYPEALLNTLRRVAVEAGDITLDYFDESGIPDALVKADGSPLTRADQEAEAHIAKALMDIDPSIPFIGEEAVAENRAADPHILASSEYVWMVDALDGTREFIKGGGEYTVNIALLRNGQPYMGAVFAPYLDEMYAGYAGGPAIRCHDGKTDYPIRVRAPLREGLTVVMSKSHEDPAKLQSFLEPLKIEKIIKYGSSLKLCAVAAGKADMYPRLGPTSFWDIAAGHAVLSAAGGGIMRADGSMLDYHWSPESLFLNSSFIAYSDPDFARALIDRT